MNDSLIQTPPVSHDDEVHDDEHPEGAPVVVVATDGPADGGVASPPAPPAPGGRLHQLWRRFVDMPLEGWISLGIVAACVGFVFVQLGPTNILSNTTPAGGDMGAHVWGPAFLRDHLLPQGRLAGWSPDWYAGFAAYEFYMVIPSLFIALLSYVIPYGVAFKLVAVSGLLTLPVAAWAFGRLNRLPFPVAPLLAVGATAFLFDRSFSILGGNIPSTLAGEFAFSIGLSFAVLYLGVLGRCLETGKHRGWAAVLLALTGLTHLIPFILALVGTLVWFLVRPGVARLKVLATTLPVAGLLTAFWSVPFLLNHGYMTDMGWERKDQYVNFLFTRDKLDPQLVNSPPINWLLAFAAVGVLMSIVFLLVDRQRGGLFWVAITVVAGVGFVLWPNARLWNARLLPFYYLGLYLLAALGVAYVGRTLAMLVARQPDKPVRGVSATVAVVASVGMLLVLGIPLRVIEPGYKLSIPGTDIGVELAWTNPNGSYQLLGLPETSDKSFIHGWADWNFSGYEGKAAYPEYHDIVATMGQLGETNGCGRAMWEHEDQHDRYGTPMALMLLPFWTDGCIGSMEGLFFEASATTPYHFLNQDELSSAPSNAMRDLPYVGGAPSKAEFDLGVQHLQMLGVKYYMAISDRMIDFAHRNPALIEVASSGPWVVFEVSGSELVQTLTNQPAVVGGDHKGHGWEDTAIAWYQDPSAWAVPLATNGPSDWQRVEVGETPDKTPVNPVEVTNVVAGTDSISFDVSEPGTPVLVKASYFPNWNVSGAEGPYRVTPNQMVVIPTGTHVELTYGRTGIDLGSSALTLIGIVLLVLLFRAKPVLMPAPRPRREWRGPTEDPVFGPEGGGGPRDGIWIDPDAAPTAEGVESAEGSAPPTESLALLVEDVPTPAPGSEPTRQREIDAVDFDPWSTIVPEDPGPTGADEAEGPDAPEPPRSRDPEAPDDRTGSES